MANVNAQREIVLVTGRSGFIGACCILQLLEAGYRMRTTVRSLRRETDVQAAAKILRARLGESARHVPTAELPDWLVRLIA